MSRIRLRDPFIPSALHGWLLVDRHGIPRYWPGVWSALEAASFEQSTLGDRLAVIEQFYQSVTAQLGEDCLDSLIAELDFDALEACLEGFFVSLHNRNAQSTVNHGGSWKTVIGFVKACTDRIARTGSFKTPLDDIHARLLRLERLHNALNLRRTRRPEAVRALPALVLEELYDLINPNSPRNPFRNESLRWRNFALILLMLHQGLRRGEALILAVDALRDAIRPDTGEIRFWLDVTTNLYEESDPRLDQPSLKNANAVRQIPVAESIANIIDTYISSYRGKQSHSFLFSSQEGSPLSRRSVNEVLVTISERLSPEARTELFHRRKLKQLHPHALRHTFAVVRLKQFIDSGTEMDIAIQQLRVFFGWSRSSQMPQLYARAYFEDRLATVWQDSFDLHVSSLRKILG